MERVTSVTPEEPLIFLAVGRAGRQLTLDGPLALLHDLLRVVCQPGQEGWRKAGQEEAQESPGQEVRDG